MSFIKQTNTKLTRKMDQVTSHDDNDCLSQEITNILQADDKDTKQMQVTSYSKPVDYSYRNLRARAGKSRAILTQVEEFAGLGCIGIVRTISY